MSGYVALFAEVKIVAGYGKTRFWKTIPSTTQNTSRNKGFTSNRFRRSRRIDKELVNL